MDTRIPIESIWQMIQPMSLKNKQWLKDKLSESIEFELHVKHVKDAVSTPSETYLSDKQILDGIEAGIRDMQAGRTRPIKDFLNELNPENER